MKYLKLFEEIDKIEPEVGDYVICKSNIYIIYPDITNVIGKIISIEFVKNGRDWYLINYENIHSTDNDRYFNREEIIFFSKSKEDCEEFIMVNKYNL